MKQFVFLLLLTLGFTSFAQREPKTLVGDGVQFTSGFGGFMLQFPSIDGRFRAMTGGGGAALINNTFYLGGYGLGMAEDVIKEYEGSTFDVDFGHGGFYTGFIIKPESLIHFEISTKLGWGGICMEPLVFDPNISYVEIDDKVFVFNPMIQAELNITEWFKFNLGAGYQLTNGVDNPVFSKTDFNGATINASFLFGWFR